jgi:hypothetical protein
MSWRDELSPVALQVARHALRSLSPVVLCPALLMLLPTASIAQADVRSLVPVIGSASIVQSNESQASPCQSLECVRRHVDPWTTVRLAGEFGRFTGHVTRWDADSLAGFEVDPDWGGSAPLAPIGWSQISGVDKRVNNCGRGAIIGAISLGALTGLYAATVASAAHASVFGFSPDAQHEVNQAALTGALIGGALGAGVGAAIGAGSIRWVVIYRRR